MENLGSKWYAFFDMELVIAPNHKLRVQTKPVKKISNGLLNKTREMIRLTKTFEDPEGVGLASTQIGESEQYFVAKDSNGSFKAFFNPKIISTSKKTQKMMEGCLSIPKIWGEVSRHTWVKVSYLDETGKQITEKLTGLAAHIFQHECDHLNGKLFIDKVLQEKNKLYKTVGKDRAGDDVFEEITL